jgi:tRNA(Ile)-lysidine synthase
MKKQLLDFCQLHDLIEKNDKVLVAVSGGRDSMVLAHLLDDAGIAIGIAHMNYKLRGEDSDLDAKTVEEFGKLLGVEVHSTKVDWDLTPELNIQEAAREKRYQFFDALCNQHHYSKVATAHHAEDNTESFFINLLRGTGIYGLQGIPVKRDNIIRPLLWASREEITNYAQQHHLPYRDDASNETDAYLRNRIRHHLIPMLNSLDPHADKKLVSSFQNLKEDAEAMAAMSSHLRSSVGANFSIDLQAIPEDSKATWLYHALRSFGFNRTQCADLLQAKEAGKKIESEKYNAVIRKNAVDVMLKEGAQNNPLTIPHPGQFNNGSVFIEVLNKTYDGVMNLGSEHKASLNSNAVTFPLSLRIMQEEDTFQPLGLDYKVNVRKFLKEKGFGPAQMKEMYVLKTSDGRICWIPEVQIAEWCKIDADTSQILSLSFGRYGN